MNLLQCLNLILLLVPSIGKHFSRFLFVRLFVVCLLYEGGDLRDQFGPNLGQQESELSPIEYQSVEHCRVSFGDQQIKVLREFVIKQC